MESDSRPTFAFGQKVKEKFTGFVGVIVAVTSYATGYNRYAVQGTQVDRSGMPVDWRWIDDTQLEVIE